MPYKKHHSKTPKKPTSGVSTGGATGSHRIRINDDYHQEKTSLRDKSIFNPRRIKARGTDRENLSEAIAACYAQAYLGKRHAPDVSTYYDAEQHRAGVVSKYLKDTKGTIDEYYTKNLGFSLGHRKHVQLVLSSEAPSTPTDGEWYVHPNTPLAKSICQSLATAALFGDHDVNPGNRMVLQKEEGALEIGMIDFGHAFNDLVHAPMLLGGRVRARENPIFDFFNRTSVTGARPGGDPSKFWRDYKGFVPSTGLADALIELGQNQAAQRAGLKAAKKEFRTLFRLIDKNPEDNETKAHILKSFNEIHHSITGQFFPYGKTDKEKIKLFFNAIDVFMQKNAENAVQAGHMMQIQLELDEALNQEIEDLNALTETYREKLKAHGLMDDHNVMTCPWFKTSLTEKQFKGSLEAYISAKNTAYLERINPMPSVLDNVLQQINRLLIYIGLYHNPEADVTNPMHDQQVTEEAAEPSVETQTQVVFSELKERLETRQRALIHDLGSQQAPPLNHN